MKILVVEDNAERLKWFANEFKEVILVVNAKDGKQRVINEKWDLIFLDHDLGNRVFVDSDDPNTGYQVAKEITNSINKDTLVIIHSYNPVGSENMQKILPKAIRMPFGTFSKNSFKMKE